MATSVTGFGFPFEHVLPSHIVGVISLVVLAVAILARYVRHLAGAWRAIYVVSAVVALYLNVFVLIVQLFLKVPALNAVAPTVRAAVCRHPTRRDGAVPRPRHRRGAQVSQPDGPYGLNQARIDFRKELTRE